MRKSNQAGRILIVDDNPDVLSAAKIFLKRHFLEVVTEKNPESLPNILMNETFDVILLDMNFTKDVSSGHEGFFWLDKILEMDPSAVVILITAYGDVEVAVKAIKEGATDFVLKPWENEKLLATVSSCMRLRESRLETNKLKDRQKQINEDLDTKYQEIIGRSDAIMKVFDTIEMVAGTDANVLILGENGTGKELVARAIHRHSKRTSEVFLSVDLGAVSETLFESELFGHTKGSFTDAKEDRAGRFETASGGTLFLDEIGNLSTPLQAKLLSVLQSRQVTRVGSNKPRPIDIRLICATNMYLYDMVKKSEFRQDLLYRINTIEINIPPLRDRLDDIPLLAEHYLGQFTKKYNKPIRSLSPSVIKRMQKYTWPGNVRELEHAVERAVIMSRSMVLEADDFFLNQGGKETDETAVNLDAYNIEEMERILIRKALKRHNGNITQAAQELGLTRSSLYRRMEKYDF
ncbi:MULTISPECIES: sigma-54 dependent transcriptional regulator [unclassified Imperialibacter]|uniref:sigma-54-dependent transcriptional regulator n=1 Tax=unclassified Imperialibacter TaxID=2629706 RepID=UPI001252103A|nr:MULTISPECIES: sigma-54 dependent transcriptional regulator [unclassified Imperialibacter]CAD5278098.1 Sigma-54-dependent Fis family transcriptional regulator [Imperialibacter sp. 89]CAD5292309.1 Sigma-54-dependent Fis family transcriptional regulator [Imperialibacter sp. 75]VVS99935.1 Sigma-54-dependent Fis family transcriptional regulator [Imperialibacter sp. EC-SDR9]